MQNNKIKATMIGTIAPILWSTYPAMSFSVSNIPAFMLLTICFTIACVFFTFYLIFTKQDVIAALKSHPKHWFISCFGIIGFNICYIISLRTAPAADAYLIASTYPILIILLGAIIAKQKLQLMHILGVILGFSGVVILAKARGFPYAEGDAMLGYSLAFIAALSWAIYSVYNNKWSGSNDNIIVGAYIVSAILSAIISVTFEEFVSPEPKQIIIFICMALGPMGVAYFAWGYGARLGDIRVLSSISFISHFMAVGWLVMLGHTELTYNLMAAISLIVAGALVGSYPMFKTPKSEALT